MKKQSIVKSKVLTLKQFKDVFCKRVFNCTWKMMRKNIPTAFTPDHMDEICEEYKDLHVKPLLQEIAQLKKESLSIPDVRNKLGPISNLIALIENGHFKGDIETSSFVFEELENCKKSIKYLSK